MHFDSIAVALGDISWIGVAFALGFLANIVRLPPLVGFLVAGFILNAFGAESGDILQKLADLGITLLLFTVGLKLDLKSLGRPQVWGTTLIHMGLVLAIFSSLLLALGAISIPVLTELSLYQALLVAFALSFSSTVFVVKVLEERGEMTSQHGRLAIGVLIMQDLVAVLFIVVSSGKLPTPWAAALLLLIPLRPLILKLLRKSGHGELLILFGLVMALGGAQLFELVGVKGDLGALILGVLISADKKAKELAETMLGFKDLFLVGFFLSIGIGNQPDMSSLLIGLALVPLVAIKTLLFLHLMLRFRLRARTALFASINLSNYSEFGLIVAAIGVSTGLMGVEWLVILAIALSGSFLLAAPLSKSSNSLFQTYRDRLRRLQTEKRLKEDRPINTQGARIAIFGMGRVGSGAYDEMMRTQDKPVIGVDHDTALIESQRSLGRNAIVGNPADPDFWEKIEHNELFDLVLLALPNVDANLAALEQLRCMNYPAQVAAVVTFEDEELILKEQGVSAVYNIYRAAGTGFAEHVLNNDN